VEVSPLSSVEDGGTGHDSDEHDSNEEAISIDFRHHKKIGLRIMKQRDVMRMMERFRIELHHLNKMGPRGKRLLPLWHAQSSLKRLVQRNDRNR
jgi:hypothetical protein